MAKLEFTFEVITQMTLEHEKGAKTSALKEARVKLNPHKPLDKSMYLDGKDLPRKDAMKPITNTLLSGLIAHVRFCAEKGWMKEGDHMNYIMEHMQGMFVQQADIDDTDVLKEDL